MVKPAIHNLGVVVEQDDKIAIGTCCTSIAAANKTKILAVAGRVDTPDAGQPLTGFIAGCIVDNDHFEPRFAVRFDNAAKAGCSVGPLVVNRNDDGNHRLFGTGHEPA
jgi:hypothetical protein